MQHFRDSVDYQDKPIDYGTIAYVECIDDMIKLITKRKVKAVVLILTEPKASHKAYAFFYLNYPSGAP